jgi:hypothetical protein
MPSSAGPLSPLDLAIAALVAARHRDPFAVLGPHEHNGATIVRAFQPAARAIELRLVSTGELLPMTLRDPAGLFEVRVDAAHGVFPASTRQAPDPCRRRAAAVA